MPRLRNQYGHDRLVADAVGMAGAYPLTVAGETGAREGTAYRSIGW